MLARAFDSAWKRFVRPNFFFFGATHARVDLATHLVTILKSGEQDEVRLSLSGFKHLSEFYEFNHSENAYCAVVDHQEGTDGRRLQTRLTHAHSVATATRVTPHMGKSDEHQGS